MDTTPSASQPPSDKDEPFFVSRIPKTKSEDQMQKIFSHHFEGCLISLNSSRKKSKSNFTTAILTVPNSVVSNSPELQKALSSPRGIQISVLPLVGLWFRPYTREKKSPEEIEILQIQEEMEKMKRNHEFAINGFRNEFERRISQLNACLDHHRSEINSQKELIRSLLPENRNHGSYTEPHRRSPRASRSYSNSPRQY